MSVVEQQTKKAKLFQFIYLKTIMHMAVSVKINTFFFFMHSTTTISITLSLITLFAEIKDNGPYLDFKRFSSLF